MATPGPRQQGSRSRLGVAIIAGGLALVLALVAGSAVIFLGSDDNGSESDASPVPKSEAPQSEPPGPPAKVELRPVLQVLGRTADCRKPGAWCVGDGSVGGYRLGPAELRTRDIVSAEARISDYGDYVVGITLSDAGAERFEQVTAELAEKAGVRAQLAIVVDGRVLSAPQVQSSIPGGEIDIAADFTPAAAKRLAAAIDP